MQALYLSRYGSFIYIIHRKDSFRASKVMQRQVLEHPKIKVRSLPGRARACRHAHAPGCPCIRAPCAGGFQP